MKAMLLKLLAALALASALSACSGTGLLANANTEYPPMYQLGSD